MADQQPDSIHFLIETLIGVVLGTYGWLARGASKNIETHDARINANTTEIAVMRSRVERTQTDLTEIKSDVKEIRRMLESR